MKQEVYLGSFDIGFENIQLYARPGSGGEFVTNPVAKIWVGVDSDWRFTQQTLLHEAQEFAMFRAGCRFTEDSDSSGDHGGYHFHMTHQQFSNVCGKVSDFMILSMSYLKKAWLQMQKIRKKKR